MTLCPTCHEELYRETIGTHAARRDVLLCTRCWTVFPGHPALRLVTSPTGPPARRDLN